MRGHQRVQAKFEEPPSIVPRATPPNDVNPPRCRAPPNDAASPNDAVRQVATLRAPPPLLPTETAAHPLMCARPRRGAVVGD